MPYVDSSTQTVIAGLTKHPSANPAPLYHYSPHLYTTPPPEDMAAEKLQVPAEGTPSISRSHADDDSNAAPTLLLRRNNRPPMVTRISLPAAEFNVEAPISPPPTETVMSPLPLANKLYAGHTPICPRSMSPLRQPEEQEHEQQQQTEEEDDMQNEASSGFTSEDEEVLSGPLTLPSHPSDGADDLIELKALDSELEKLAKEQETTVARVFVDSSPIQHAQEPGPRRRSSAEEVEVVDGVILKKPKMNFGAPLGQVSSAEKN